MKKLIFLAIIAFILLLSCDEAKIYTVTIENKTTKEVSYFYNGKSEKIESLKTNKYKVTEYTPPPSKIADDHGIASVRLNRGSDVYTFVNAASRELHVLNTLPISITIEADNFIEVDNEIDGTKITKLTIDGHEESKTAKIYTNRPNFSSDSNYPVLIEWRSTANILYVTIK